LLFVSVVVDAKGRLLLVRRRPSNAMACADAEAFDCERSWHAPRSFLDSVLDPNAGKKRHLFWRKF